MPQLYKGWLYPPTRREVTLILFSLTVFILSYNLEASLQLVGVKPVKLSGSYLSAIGLGGNDPGYDRDGRRPKEWRDELENIVAGEWEWEEGKAAGVVTTTAAGPVGTAAIYNADLNKGPGRGASKGDQGIGLSEGISPREQFVRWQHDVPIATAVAHVPGYTIMDNVIMVNGSFYLVTDDASSLPPLEYIASSSQNRADPPHEHEWEILNKTDAAHKLGPFGGRVFGTTWLALDRAEEQDPYTLLSLLRTHSTLAAPTLSSSFSPDAPGQGTNVSLSKVQAPLRLIFPNVPTFSSPHIPLAPGVDPKTHPEPREKSYIGIHPLLQKTALPTLGIWYTEDWQDFVDINAPWIFDRVIIADRGAAARGRDLWMRGWSSVGGDLATRADGDENKPAWAAPFVGLRMKPGWWTPVRNSLLTYLRLPELQGAASKGSFWGKPAAPKPVVTYVSMQDEPAGAGARLSDEDHAALVAGLQRLQREDVISEVHVVKGNGSVGVHGWEWAERMSAIARSSIVLGPYGYHLADSIFMSPSAWQDRDGVAVATRAPGEIEQTKAAPLLMEFFPPGTFVPDQEFAVRSLGMRYVGWWNERKFSSRVLPPVSQATNPSERVPVRVDDVVQFIRDETAHRTIP